MAMTHAADVRRIEATKGWASIGFREIWAYRELLYFFTWRDIKVRYKQTVLGAGWAVIQPVTTMIVFSLFFGRLAKVPSDGVPYPLFSFAALVPWTFFATGLTNAATSLVASAPMIKKIYFPRLLIPISAPLAAMVDFVIALAVLFAMMMAYGVTPTVRVFVLPLLVLLALMTALGVGLWLAAMNLQFRDVKYFLPFVVQLWLFASPVAYSSSLIENPMLRTAYALNPMAGVIQGFRWALLGSGPGLTAAVGVSTGVSLGLLISGTYYFRRLERTFADVA